MHIILDTPGGTGLYLSFNTIAWLFTVVLISLGLWQVTLNKKIYYSKTLLWLVLGYVYLVIPVFYDFEFTDHAIPRILALTAGLLFLVSLYQFKVTKKDIMHLLLVLLAAVAIEATFALIQFFIFAEGDWGGYKLGISRPHGVFLQPNVMASFMATGLAIAMFLSVKSHYFKFTKSFYALIYFGLFATSFLLVLLQSRTGYIGAIVAIFFLCPYLYTKNAKRLSTNLIVISIGVITALACFDNSSIPKRGVDIYQSAGARSSIFIVSADLIKTQPLLGVGYGGFERGFIDHFNHYAVNNPDIGNTIQRLSHPHNEVLFWVAEGGVVALLGFVIFAIAYILIWLKIPTKKALALLALLLPILLHSQLEFPFYSSVSHFLIFLLLLWITDRYAAIYSNKQQAHQDEQYVSWPEIVCSKTFLIRFCALLIPAIFIPFLTTSMHTARILVEHEKSGFQNIEKLTQIINPIAWQSRLDAAVYAHILISAVKEKNAEKLENYINWALKRIKHKPRVGLYKNILLAMKILDKSGQYQQLLAEVKQTYPLEEDWDKNTFTLPDFQNDLDFRHKKPEHGSGF